jgi:hypothetical protein
LFLWFCTIFTHHSAPVNWLGCDSALASPSKNSRKKNSDRESRDRFNKDKFGL